MIMEKIRKSGQQMMGITIKVQPLLSRGLPGEILPMTQTGTRARCPERIHTIQRLPREIFLEIHMSVSYTHLRAHET